MSAAETFKETIKQLITSRYSKDWTTVEEFTLILKSHKYLHTKIVKTNQIIKVSLFNEKTKDDPIVTFTIDQSQSGNLHFLSIKYQNGLTLFFRSELQKNEFDIEPEDLNSFLKDWTKTLPDT